MNDNFFVVYSTGTGKEAYKFETIIIYKTPEFKNTE